MKKVDEKMFTYGFGAGFGAAVVLGAAAFGTVKLVEYCSRKWREKRECCDGECDCGCDCEEDEEMSDMDVNFVETDDDAEVSADIVKKSVNATEEVVSPEFERNDDLI